MPRSDEPSAGISPSSAGGDRRGYRHYGDGIAGQIDTARVQGYNPSGPGYVDVQVDANGVIQTASSGGGGGAVTIADGADVAQGATTDADSASTVVGLLKKIKALLTGTLSVSGTFWQATQPVSLASAPVTPVTDNAGSLTVDSPVGTPVFVRLSDGTTAIATLPVSLASAPVTPVTDNGGSLTVDGVFWQATQPVSAAQLPAALAAAGGMKVEGVAGGVAQPISAASLPLPVGAATDAVMTGGAQVVQVRSAPLIVTVTGAAAGAVTATLPLVAGQFHYITKISIIKYASVATVGAAAPTVVTTTNLPGSLAFTLPTALAVGTQYELDVEPTSPIKSSVAATATTIVAASLASIIYRVTVYYYTAA